MKNVYLEETTTFDLHCKKIIKKTKFLVNPDSYYFGQRSTFLYTVNETLYAK